MTLDAKTLGEAIADVRKRRGLTQREVAEAAGLTINYVSLVENGARAPSQEGLNSLATALGVPAGWITFLAESPDRSAMPKPFAKLTKVTRDLLLAAIDAETNGVE